MSRTAPSAPSAPFAPAVPSILLGFAAALGLAFAPAPAAAQDRPAAVGVGDPYYPALGNPGLDVRRYALALDVDMESGQVRAEAVLTATATSDLESFHLDLVGLTVDGVTVDGVAAEVARGDGELIVTPAAPLASGADLKVCVRYHGVPAPIPEPALPIEGVGWMRHQGGVFVLSEVGGARSFVPCNDHPSDKAAWSFAVTVDPRYTVAANGLPGPVTTGEDGRRTWTFATDLPMATYLATVVIGELDVEESETAGGLPLRHYFPPTLVDGRRAPFRRAGDMIEFFAARFGPYPFESFGGVVSTLPLPAALETQTLPVYGLFAGQDHVIAHELAHQWFGNSVSVATWPDIWLSEGLAEYAAWLWLEHDQGEDAFLDHVDGHDEMMRAMRIEAPYDPGVEDLFGTASYVRGPLAAHALRLEVGDESFFAILQAWTARHRHANASVEDLLALVAELGGDDARAVLDRWLKDPVPPALP